MNKCTFTGCTNNAFNTKEECALHFKKRSATYGEDFNSSFYQDLIAYIQKLAVKELPLKNYDPNVINPSNINSILHSQELNQQKKEAISKFLNELPIELADIDFPVLNNDSNSNYLRVLEKLKPIHFKNCSFRFQDTFFIQNKTISFEDCIFHSDWDMKALDSDSISQDVKFKNCEFRRNITIKSDTLNKASIQQNLFSDCNFRKKLAIERISFDLCLLFKNSDNKLTNIREIHIIECEFNNKFSLNHCEVFNFCMKDSVLNSKFEFKNNKVMNQFELNNTNYVKIVDMYESKFHSKFEIRKSIFNDFVGFEKCEFYETENTNAAQFVYATFLSFVNFRNTKFMNGLNIENINLKETPNFLNTIINPANTNRETFRIVKNSFDKSGNLISAHKFFAEEMRKYKAEVNISGKFTHKLILNFNSIFSNFGQSYLRPFFSLVIFTLIYYCLQLGYAYNVLYEIHPPYNDMFLLFSHHLNGLAKSVTPFTRFLYEGMEFLSLFFYIFNSIFIWLTIVAIKRCTQR
ncbi:hypothetical protein [Nitrosomonas ureae]|uniref:Pentapeptide repeat-containing protein n=1 Tax=Nitrosomonas ureae TaxID=44577 RepID=A0A1H9G8B6_9PROT|nr:hypothetical protein [Nitrosomonas ureae]SEQ46361.1 hypothetical protein SAMN05421510_105713 [Nitrosomonas ureae]